MMAREGNDMMTFSYNLVHPLYRRTHQRSEKTEWVVMEKGSDKTSEEHQFKISYDMSYAALTQIRRYIVSDIPSQQNQQLRKNGFNIFLKGGSDLVTNSIKSRGVIYSLLNLSEEQKRKGVIAISRGYFAHSLCYYGKKLGIPITVVLPTPTHSYEVDECHDLGARVNLVGNMIEAHKQALRLAQEKGLVYLDGNDHPNMIIGQSTLGIDIVNDIEHVDAVILPAPIHGCGLSLGMAIAIKGKDPNIEIIEVQLDSVDPLIECIRALTLSSNELNIVVRKYPWYTHKQLPKVFDAYITAKYANFLDASEYLMKQGIIDFNAALCLSAILSGQLNYLKGKRVVIPMLGLMDLSIELPTSRIFVKNLAGPSNA